MPSENRVAPRAKHECRATRGTAHCPPITVVVFFEVVLFHLRGKIENEFVERVLHLLFVFCRAYLRKCDKMPFFAGQNHASQFCRSTVTGSPWGGRAEVLTFDRTAKSPCAARAPTRGGETIAQDHCGDAASLHRRAVHVVRWHTRFGEKACGIWCTQFCARSSLLPKQRVSARRFPGGVNIFAVLIAFFSVLR